jgi:type VII secretion integral membrane protein EccD
MLLDLAKEGTPDGGVRHGGWTLGKVGNAPFDPARTLVSLGIVDGDMLQIRKRTDQTPPPLFDDVIEAIAESTPTTYRAWSSKTATTVAHIGAGVAFVAAALGLFLAGPMDGGKGLIPAIVAAVIAVASVAIGATVSRSYGAPTTGVIIAATGGLPFAFVAGLYIVPVQAGGVVGAPNFLLASALTLIFATSALLLTGAGTSVFIAAVLVSAFGVLSFLAGIIFADIPSITTAGIGAAAAAIALMSMSALPRLTIQLAKLPLPEVTQTEGLDEDTTQQTLDDQDPMRDYVDFADIEKRTSLAHDYLTGMIIGCGSVATIGAFLATSYVGAWGYLFAIMVALVLLMRGRAYINGVQAVALLTTGILTATGAGYQWLTSLTPDYRLFFAFGTFLVIGIGALVIGIVFPQKTFSPGMRRSVDWIEAIFIISVIPLALAVLNVYSYVRHSVG